MEILFEQESRLSETGIREEMAYRYWQSPAAVRRYAAELLLFGLLLCMRVWLGYIPFGFWACAAIIISTWVFRVILYFIGIRNSIEAAKDANHGELYMLKRTVTEENICFQNSLGAQKILGYDQFPRAVRLKSCILLFSKNDGTFCIAREGFTKGTPEALIAILRSKGVNVK